MNKVCLIGRLTRDPELRWTAQATAVASFNIAIDRRGEGADFPKIICFGKTAENCEQYLAKGRQVGRDGRIQTGSYEKNGQKIYTCDVIAERVEFIGTGKKENDGEGNESFSAIPEGFEEIDDIPF